MVRYLLLVPGYFWAAPCSILGLMFGILAILSGARAQIVMGNLEVSGGGLLDYMSKLNFICRFSAITFGHVILARDLIALSILRDHERIHVRQYEVWGPFFIPAYLLSSLWQWLNHRHPYYDNYFEREAYNKM